MAITPEMLEKIGQAVAEIEKQSAIEIVPCFVARTSRYRTFRAAGALAVGALTSLILLGLELMHQHAASWKTYSPTPLEFTLTPLLAALTAGVVFSYPRWFRHLLPASLKRRKVIQAAREYFLTHEVFATRHRTGVLLLIAEFERQIYVLADKGVAEKLSPETWNELGKKLAMDFRAGLPGDSFIAALQTLAAEVAPHFPDTHGQNELPNIPRQH